MKLKIARAKRAKLLFFIGRVYTRGRLRRLDALNVVVSATNINSGRT